MKKLLLTFLTILSVSTFAFAQNNCVIKGGVAIDKVPNDFYGTWRVSSKIMATNNPDIFKQKNLDLWNLSRSGDVITLENPFSGAHASIIINEISGALIRFKKVGDYDNKKLSDEVTLNLSKSKFTGTNSLKLETVSKVDGKTIKKEWATYSLTGEKISGQSIK